MPAAEEVSDMERDAAMELENRIATIRRFSTNVDTERLGAQFGYTCPGCGGSLVSTTRDMARKPATRLFTRRYTAIAEEAEHALTLLSDRLSTTAQEGEAG